MTPDDYGWLFDTAVMSDVGSRWRLHGDIPTFDEFMTGLLAGAVATCLIERLDGQPLGMVQLWQHQPVSGHAQITAFLSATAEGAGWPLEGIVLFADYSFRAYGLRKIYLESLSPELARYQSLVGSALVEEGCLRGHRFVFGEWQDLHILAMYRDTFYSLVGDLLPGVVRP